MAVLTESSLSGELPNVWKSPGSLARPAKTRAIQDAAKGGAYLLITTFFKTAGALMLHEDLASNYDETLNYMD